MSLKQKLISAATLAFAIVAFTTFASAQNTATRPTDSTVKQERGEHRGFGKHGGAGKFGKGERHGGMMREFSRLDLTDAQKTQIKTLTEANRTANQATFQEMRGLMMKKRDGSITADEQTRLEQLRTQSRAAAEQTHTTILSILTAEQRAQLEQMKAERKQRMQERRQNRQKPAGDTDNN